MLPITPMGYNLVQHVGLEPTRPRMKAVLLEPLCIMLRRLSTFSAANSAEDIKLAVIEGYDPSPAP